MYKIKWPIKIPTKKIKEKLGTIKIPKLNLSRFNIFKKLRRYNSFYLILIFCIIAIIGTGIAVSSGIFGDKKGQEIVEKENINKEQDMHETIAFKGEEEKEKENEKEEDSLPKIEEEEKGSPKEEETIKEEKGLNVNLHTMRQPVLGKIIVEFAKDSLVYSNTLEQWQTHMGIDIAVEEGTPVKAVLPGTIKEVFKDLKLGYTVVIDHGSNIQTKYANLKSEPLIEEGRKVNTGDIIGEVGKTAPFEIADSPHLHFEVIKDGKRVDPLNYLPDTR